MAVALGGVDDVRPSLSRPGSSNTWSKGRGEDNVTIHLLTTITEYTHLKFRSFEAVEHRIAESPNEW